MNLYGFAGGDPVNFGDPFGLCATPDGGDDGKPCPMGDQIRAKINEMVQSTISTLGGIGNSMMSGLSWLGEQAAIQGGIGLATGGLGNEAEAGVTLYRAVDAAEAADFAASGVLRAGGSSVEGKYFATSAADAATWGQKLIGDGYRVIEAKFPASVSNAMHSWGRLDGIGPAKFATLDQLKSAAARFIK